MLPIRDYPSLNVVKVGQLYLKPSSIYPTITQCCRMVLHEAEDRTLPLWRSGSATLIKHGGRNYVVMTRHQLGIPRGSVLPKDVLETIRVSSGIGGKLENIPLRRCVYETANFDQEYHDLLVFEAAPEWDNKTADTPYFFPLTG